MKRKTAIQICHTAYEAYIDTLTNLPLYVSHAINKENIEAGNITRKRPYRYTKDSLYAKLNTNAFAGTGYDHGHIAPARDFKWDSLAWEESFLMTNISPQHACLNQKAWCFLESLSRHWSQESDSTIIYIISGIIPDNYKDTLFINENLQVSVPDEFYKLILAYNLFTKEAKGIAFVIKNSNVKDEEIFNLITTIKAVEDKTSLVFLHI